MSKQLCRISSSSIPLAITPSTRGITEEGTASGAALIASYIIFQTTEIPKDLLLTDVYPSVGASTLIE